jgi:hypothetical protein
VSGVKTFSDLAEFVNILLRFEEIVIYINFQEDKENCFKFLQVKGKWIYPSSTALTREMSGHVACMVEMRNPFKILVRKSSEGKRSLDRPIRRWTYNVTVDLTG